MRQNTESLKGGAAILPKVTFYDETAIEYADVVEELPDNK